MNLSFYKCQACGNDYILIDEDRNPKFTGDDRKALSKILLDRHFSIGADTLLFVRKEKDLVQCRIFEDGAELDMCGNGIRCAADLYLNESLKTSLRIMTKDKIVRTVAYADGLYRVDMGPLNEVGRYLNDKKLKKYSILSTSDLFSHKTIKTKLNNLGIYVSEGYFLNSGEAHTVLFVKDVSAIDLKEVGEYIGRNRQIFTVGTNVNIVQKIDRSTIMTRTYERSSFQETLACGTGNVASACAAKYKYGLDAQKIRVVNKGGEQFVVFEGESIHLIGPAKQVFTGQIDVDFK